MDDRITVEHTVEAGGTRDTLEIDFPRDIQPDQIGEAIRKIRDGMDGVEKSPTPGEIIEGIEGRYFNRR